MLSSVIWPGDSNSSNVLTGHSGGKSSAVRVPGSSKDLVSVGDSVSVSVGDLVSVGDSVGVSVGVWVGVTVDVSAGEPSSSEQPENAAVAATVARRARRFTSVLDSPN